MAGGLELDHVGAQVAQAKNTFAVAHDNAFDPGIPRMGKDLIDQMSVRIAEKQTAWFPHDFAKLLAGFAHGRGINNRQCFLNVMGDQRVKERFVGILEIPHEAVLL